MALESLQKRFVESVLAADGEAPLPPGLQGAGSLSPRAALEVYRRGYRARLTEALGETFEALWWTLGDEAFTRLAAAYVAANPSPFDNLSDYGHGFPAFVGRDPASRELPFLRELGDFEWAFKELFHAAEEEPAALAGLPKLAAAPGARLRLVSNLRLRRHSRAVYAVWKRRGGAETELPASLWDAPERLLLVKRGGVIAVHALEEAEFSLLEGLERGVPLGELLSEEIETRAVTAAFGLVARERLLAGP